MNALAQPTASASLDQALAALQDSEPAVAAAGCRELIALFPREAEPRYWLHSALQAAGDLEGARLALNDARTLHGMEVIRAAQGDTVRMQSDKAYAAKIGAQLYDMKLMAAAGVALGRALDFDEPDLKLLLNYGLALQHQGRMDEALDVFTAAGEIFPSPAVHEFALFPLFFLPDRAVRVRAAAEHWAQLYAEPMARSAPVFPNARTADRPLKVGYVGPTFTGNQVAQFLMPILEAHDPATVDLHLYSAAAETEPGLPETARRRSIQALSDQAVAERIRADGIDILIDVWGHTVGSRLGVFAYRPAPVQIAWINFVQTTGLSAIDYVMHADGMDAPGTADMFIEKIWRMGEIMAPFRPLPGRPDVAPTPALRNGYVTYGSFNNPAKLSDATVRAWASILRARPVDRLVLKYGLFIDAVLRRATLARFSAYGVGADQIEFRRESTGADYLAEFQDIDLALDPSPCPGGTTTCDALSNGVPLLTLKGEDFYARIGLPGVLPCGLPELVAEDWDDYVARALALTADAQTLDRLRQRVRPGFEASAYRDEAGFTRKLEGQFRQMFELWLARTAA